MNYQIWSKPQLSFGRWVFFHCEENEKSFLFHFVSTLCYRLYLLLRRVVFIPNYTREIHNEMSITFFDSGNRFIIASGSMWMREFAQTLEREFKSQGG